MTEVEIFKYKKKQVRTQIINDKIYFIGKDVADILGYKATSDALKRHVDEDDKVVSEIPTPGGMKKMIVISESGLYSLILSSKLESAKKFKKWITSKVLQSKINEDLKKQMQKIDVKEFNFNEEKEIDRTIDAMKELEKKDEKTDNENDEGENIESMNSELSKDTKEENMYERWWKEENDKRYKIRILIGKYYDKHIQELEESINKKDELINKIYEITERY